MRTWQQAIEAIRQVQTRKGRAAFGRFSIEGTRHIERALRASVPLEQIVVAESYWLSAENRAQSIRTTIEASTIPVAIAPDDAFKPLVGGRKLGAIVGLAPLLASPALTTLNAKSANPVYLVLVDIVEPGNVGAMIRTAHGLGATACVTIGSSDPFHPKAVRTAMGSSFKLPIVQFATVGEALRELKAAEVTLYATVAEDGVALPHVAFAQGPIGLLMGSEFYGLSAETVTSCDHPITIPMARGIDSFSVSAAAAIVLYAANRTMNT